MADEQFLYDGTRVKKTGVKAGREVRKVWQWMYEITPVDENDGNWKRFVNERELFKIFAIGEEP